MKEEPLSKKVEWLLKNLAKTSNLTDLRITYGHGKANGYLFKLISGLIGCFRKLKHLEYSVSHNTCEGFDILSSSL